MGQGSGVYAPLNHIHQDTIVIAIMIAIIEIYIHPEKKTIDPDLIIFKNLINIQEILIENNLEILIIAIGMITVFHPHHHKETRTEYDRHRRGLNL